MFTDHLIKRNDFLGVYANVKYKNGFQVRNYKRWAEQLKSASGVFIVGADALDGSYSTRHSLRFFRLAQMAHKMQIPVYFSGFSVSLKMTGPAKEALKEVSNFSFLKARDIDSYNRLLTFVSPQHIKQVSDMAFICPYNPDIENTKDFKQYKEWTEQQHLSKRKIIAFCPNSIQAEKLGWDVYIGGIKKLLSEFNRQAEIAILYLYHDVRPLFNGKSDKDISRELFEAEILNDNTRCYFQNGIENGVVLKSYLKYADFTMTGRMHFGISGLAAGKPMFGISYANKFEGMLRLFEIDPTTSLVDYTEMDKGLAVVSKFINDIENQYHSISENIGKVKELSNLNGKDLIDAR
ncbi:MAG: hypothetical protein DI598_19410 [Pseudopedobacter saltans]|uniref:Polysaccharide pyruvyl transferase domain-containing protein n=1 Tax=Pseudopedobacter saltans TaxID=151895 RepID=A0A2W5GDS6_9SPHI|nr:MAG: hypothetical protein DI598_19410 [Pseudopedobacter saltans]